MAAEVLQQAVAAQRRSEKRRGMILTSFGLLLATSFILDIMTGPSMIDVSSVLYALLQWAGLPFQVDESTQVIVSNLRLPIALMAIFVGGSLGMGGAEMQTLLNNSMASPYT